MTNPHHRRRPQPCLRLRLRPVPETCPHLPSQGPARRGRHATCLSERRLQQQGPASREGPGCEPFQPPDGHQQLPGLWERGEQPRAHDARAGGRRGQGVLPGEDRGGHLKRRRCCCCCL